ncbi:unnamed protein product, partial [Microthlaspi erraticum]
GGPNGQPPLPVSSPPPLPPSHPPSHSSSLFPSTAATVPPLSSSYPQMPNASPSSAQLAPTRSKVMDVSHLLKPPHRSTRPDHFVIILRGLPGSGKSYLAKLLRDIEVENGGSAPRIHSMDDYFMTEVEKVEESDSKSSSSGRSKRPIVKKVMEYCYEPEMEEAYRSSMLKAFKRTLEDGAFSFVIVDDRNLRVADFAQFWATAKIEPNAVSWRKLFVVNDQRIESQYFFQSGSFFIDEEKKVLVLYVPPNKIAFIIKGNGYYEEVKLGRSDEGTLMCSYVPSSVQIQQVHAGRNRKRRTRSLRYFTK